MRSTTATGRALAVGLMVLFSLALAGQNAWGAETSTKARPDKQRSWFYKKNPCSLRLAKARVEPVGAGTVKGTGSKNENVRRKGIGREGSKLLAHLSRCDKDYLTCIVLCTAGGGTMIEMKSCTDRCKAEHDKCVKR